MKKHLIFILLSFAARSFSQQLNESSVKNAISDDLYKKYKYQRMQENSGIMVFFGSIAFAGGIGMLSYDAIETNKAAKTPFGHYSNPPLELGGEFLSFGGCALITVGTIRNFHAKRQLKKNK